MVWLSLLLRWVLLAVAVELTAWVMPDVSLEGGVWASLWVALLVALVNVVLQGLLLLLPRPDNVLMLTVLTLAVNGLLLWGVSALTSRFSVDGFLPAAGAALLISIFAVVLEAAAVRVLPGAATRDEPVPG